MYNYLILGGGPAGLSFANRLLQRGETSFLVLEREREAGGLCRSAKVDGCPLDIGGGHFLDVRRPKVNDFLFQFMPRSEWNLFKRDSRIELNGAAVSHPIEANIWQMSIDEQVRYLKSVAAAGCNAGQPVPARFADWIYWKLGDAVARDYMLPYNRKMFGENLDALGTYWLDKLPNVSFEETLRSCLEKRPYGIQPGHAEFFYPKEYGYGELWLRMAGALGGRIRCGADVTALDCGTNTVTTADGAAYTGARVVVTVPWPKIGEMRGAPDNITRAIGRLKYSAVEVEYFSENMDTPAHWIYYPDEELPYHRILLRHNFCRGSRGYWTETNADRAAMKHAPGQYKYMNHCAYPLNTVDKPEVMDTLLAWAKTEGIYGLGRWGEWIHYNSDATVERAMSLADALTQ